MKTFVTYSLLLLALLAGDCSQAQIYVGSLYGTEQYVFSTAGASDTTTAYRIDWTIGEPIIESLTGSKKQLTQGFHQSLLNAKSTYIFSALDQDNSKHFDIFPNPFVSNLSVQWNFSENLNLLFEIFTLDGKRIFLQRQNAMDLQLLIRLSDKLTPSTYILRISDPQRNFFETHKIVKI